MANYSREEAEKQGNAEVGAGVAALAGIFAAAVIGNANKKNKNKKKEEINQKIQKKTEEINDYKSKLFGSTLYADEIRALEKDRENLRKELKNL